MIEQKENYKISNAALELAEKLNSVFEAGVKSKVSFDCMAEVAQQELAEWKVNSSQERLANS